MFRMLRAASTFALSASLSLSACASSPTGVHVSVATDTTRALGMFDHVTVTAEAGSKKSVACLYRDVGPTVGVGASADPCADDPRLVWNGPPTDKSWTLDARTPPLSANFDFDDDADVTVHVSAWFGSREVGQATTNLVAGAPFAETTLTLAPIPTPAPMGEEGNCVSALNLPIAGTSSEAVGCSGAGGAVESQEVPSCTIDETAGLPRHTHGTFCLPDTPRGRVAFRNTDGCAGPELPLVYQVTLAGVDASCNELSLNLHFARCADGTTNYATCPLTSDCVVPATQLALAWTAVRGRIEAHTEERMLSDCVPATIYPVVIAPIEVAAHFTLRIRQEAAGNVEKACALIVESGNLATTMDHSGCYK